MLLLLTLIVSIIFFLYLLIDLASSNPNAFFNKWTRKTLWVWLPFYALRRLIREIFFDKR
jgi:hypothetical protein